MSLWKVLEFLWWLGLVLGVGLKVIARRGMTHGVMYDGIVWRSMVDVGAWL